MKVKICGLTNLEDAQKAVDLGADYLGFIFAESPRQADPEMVRVIISNLKRPVHVKCVGVFVNEQIEIMEALAADCNLDLLQLHGDETVEEAKTLNVPWYKAFRIGEAVDIEKMLKWRCSRYLADAKVQGVYGGTGKQIKEELVLYTKKQVKLAGKEFFLAGGITADNVLQMINLIQPDGIDVSSGIEESVGKKDFIKMEKLFRELYKHK